MKTRKISICLQLMLTLASCTSDTVLTSTEPEVDDVNKYLTISLANASEPLKTQEIKSAIVMIGHFTEESPNFSYQKKHTKKNFVMDGDLIKIKLDNITEGEYQVYIIGNESKTFIDAIESDKPIFEKVNIHRKLNYNTGFHTYQRMRYDIIPCANVNKFGDIISDKSVYNFQIDETNNKLKPARLEIELERLVAEINVHSDSQVLSQWNNPDEIKLKFKGFMVINCMQDAHIIQPWVKIDGQYFLEQNPYWDKESNMIHHIPGDNTFYPDKEYSFRWLLPEFVKTDSDGNIIGYAQKVGSKSVVELFDEDPKYVLENNYNKISSKTTRVNRRYYTTGVIMRFEADRPFTMGLKDGNKTIRAEKQTSLTQATYYENKEVYYTYYLKDQFDSQNDTKYYTVFRNRKYNIHIKSIQAPGGVYPFGDLKVPTDKKMDLENPPTTRMSGVMETKDLLDLDMTVDK